MVAIGRVDTKSIRNDVLNGIWAPEDDATSGCGMDIIIPTSIVVSNSFEGAKAKIIPGTGIVEFSECMSLSINGVFSASYDNYLLVWYGICTTLYPYTYIQWRSNNITDTSSVYSNEYVYYSQNQQPYAGRSDGTAHSYDAFFSLNPSGFIHYIYGPSLSQKTVSRSIGVANYFFGQPAVWDNVSTHNTASSYDGFSMGVQSGFKVSGKVSIYGLVG